MYIYLRILSNHCIINGLSAWSSAPMIIDLFPILKIIEKNEKVLSEIIMGLFISHNDYLKINNNRSR